MSCGAHSTSQERDGDGDERDWRAVLSQAQCISAAVESGLKAQRSQLQLQLEMAAQREAMLEARLL